MSISLVQNILVLNQSCKLVSCVKVDYESKKQHVFGPINSILYSCMGVVIDIGRKGIHYADVYMYLPVKMSELRLFHCGPPCSYNNSFY